MDAAYLTHWIHQIIEMGFDQRTYLKMITRRLHFFKYGDERIHITHLRVDGKEHPF